MLTRDAVVVLCLALPAGIPACAPSEPTPPADLVLRGGRVVTVDDALPEAEAIAIEGYRIAAVGSNREIDARVGPRTAVIDLEGRLAIPGFIEGHGHYMDLGRAKTILDLRDARTWDEIVERVREAAREARPGDWILGQGWHQEKWAEAPHPSVDGVPLHHALSEASPRNPVSLAHASGHAIFANAAALELAGIDAGTPDPPGGTIVRDAESRPTPARTEPGCRSASASLAPARSPTCGAACSTPARSSPTGATPPSRTWIPSRASMPR
jgi:hypothetical protein